MLLHLLFTFFTTTYVFFTLFPSLKGFYEELWGGPQNEFCVCYGKPVKTG